MPGNPLTRALASVGLWANEVGPVTPPDPFDPRYWGGISSAALSGQVVTSETGLQLDVVQAVLERLAGTISALPMMVFERTGDSSREVARDHPLFALLHRRPNPRQTAQEFRDQQQRQLAWHRNALAIIRPDPVTGHPVGALEPVDWTRVRRIYQSRGGQVFYEIQPLGMAAAQSETYSEDEVWHIRKAPLTVDGLAGQPVFQTARETLGYALAVRQFGALYFANGGSGGGVLKHPGNFRTPADMEAFLSAWRSGGAGLNRHKDRLLLFGLDYTPFAVRNDEAQFIETQKQAEIQVSRLWNMPPHMVGILDRATFSNIEQQSIEYVVHTLAPWICAWEQAAARDLLIGEDQDRYFVELNVAGLLRGDVAARYRSYGLGRQWGWLSVNDIRRLENLDPIGPDGDRYLEPVNMSAVGEPGDDDTSQQPPDDDEGAEPSDGSGDPGKARA